MERASVAWRVAAKPHGWVHAALGIGDVRPRADMLNNFKMTRLFDTFKGSWCSALGQARFDFWLF